MTLPPALDSAAESPPGAPRALLAAISGTAAGVFPVFLTAALAVQVGAELGFSEDKLGLSVAAYFAVAALSSVTLGRLGDRVGPRHALQLACALSALVLASLSQLANSWLSLTVILAAGGLSNALAQPAANALLSRAVRPGRQGFAFGVKQAAIPLTTLLGGLMVPLLALRYGWRSAYLAGALLSGLALLAPPRDTKKVREQTGSEGTVADTRAALGVLTAALLIAAASANCLGTFAVSSAVRAGMSEASAGATFTIASVAGILGRVIAGALADRRGGRHLLVVAGMIGVGSLGGFSMALSTPLWVALGTVLGFGIGWAWPGLSNFAVVRAHRHAPAGATGITQMGVYVGAVVGPAAFGFVAHHHSYAWAWVGTAIVSLGAAFLVLWARRLLVRARRAAQSLLET